MFLFFFLDLRLRFDGPERVQNNVKESAFSSYLYCPLTSSIGCAYFNVLRQPFHPCHANYFDCKNVRKKPHFIYRTLNDVKYENAANGIATGTNQNNGPGNIFRTKKKNRREPTKKIVASTTTESSKNLWRNKIELMEPELCDPFGGEAGWQTD